MGFFIMVNLVTFGAFAIIVARFIMNGDKHFLDFHHIGGLVLVVVMLGQTILGVVSDKLWNPTRTTIPWWDKAHWWLGRLSGLLALAVMSFSMVAYVGYISRGIMIGFFVWEGLVIVAFVLAEIFIGQEHHKEPATGEKVEMAAGAPNPAAKKKPSEKKKDVYDVYNTTPSSKADEAEAEDAPPARASEPVVEVPPPPATSYPLASAPSNPGSSVNLQNPSTFNVYLSTEAMMAEEERSKKKWKLKK
jgi:hypothetical protein